MSLRIKRITTVGNAAIAQTSTAFSIINKDIDRSTDFKTINAGAGVTITDDAAGNLTIANSGGAQAPQTAGTFTANGATTVTVAAPTLTANSSVVITLKTVGGTVGPLPYLLTVTPGTGFTVHGTTLDTSVYNYLIIG